MAEDVQKIRETTVRVGDTLQKTTVVAHPGAKAARQQDTLERGVWFLAAVLLVLLGFRFLLSLLGANPVNGFADFIYTASHPFVSPFFSLFRYNNFSNGVSHFEAYTLVAMLFYLLVAWGIAKLITLNRE